MTERKSRSKLINEIQIAGFAAVEANLYLDTHPYDTEALNALERYSEARLAAIDEYESLYGPLFAFGNGDSDSYQWVKDPFPWEKED